ncbi:hypothetical protein [Streptomyces sp. NBC_01304]|uniref:hypothetical protein n=1 Tax=Streptomyces sp. NBC_01304 TaxID=2903818 RepID=UPI002E13F558|nr:hypothetical protein OG430_44145 [Streptomyces sp. NBC_01304]
MNGMWFVYSGAAAVLLSALALMVAGRPVLPLRRDPVALGIGAVAAVVVGILAVTQHAEPAAAWSSAALWLTGAATGAHALRYAVTSRSER